MSMQRLCWVLFYTIRSPEPPLSPLDLVNLTENGRSFGYATSQGTILPGEGHILLTPLCYHALKAQGIKQRD